MKVVNVVLSVLILLLAAASAVFSYFLFEKRGELVGSWNKMTAIVSKTAAEMDKNSGTKVAQELSVDALNATAYADLDSKLSKLPNQARDLATARTKLAESLRQVGRTVGNNSVDEQSLAAVKGGEEQANKVIQSVRQYQERHDKLARDISNASAKLGAKLNYDDVRNGTANALSPMLKQVDNMRERQTALESGFSRIGSATGAGAIDTRNLGNSINKIAGAVDKLKQDLCKSNSDLAAARNTISNRDGQINSLKGEIAQIPGNHQRAAGHHQHPEEGARNRRRPGDAERVGRRFSGSPSRSPGPGAGRQRKILLRFDRSRQQLARQAADWRPYHRCES